MDMPQYLHDHPIAPARWDAEPIRGFLMNGKALPSKFPFYRKSLFSSIMNASSCPYVCLAQH